MFLLQSSVILTTVSASRKYNNEKPFPDPVLHEECGSISSTF